MSLRPSILIIDDEPDLRATLCDVLEDEGWHAVGAADGAEALALLRQGLRPRLILLDLVMPGMDGWRFREAQAADPALASIPVILLCAEQHARSAPIDVAMLLRKPVGIDELTQTVQRFSAVAA